MNWRDCWSRWIRPLQPARAEHIPDAQWARLLEAHTFLAWRPPADVDRLRLLSARFLRQKEFHGAQGFQVTDEMALAVAAQACLPVLHWGLGAYDGFVGIVMHAGPVRARREQVDECGLVHTWEEELVGEAMGDGPVMLSWQEGVDHPGAHRGPAFNLVIHEFVHLIDELDGNLDGKPPLPSREQAHWQQTLQHCFDRFDERSACGYESVIDAYGAQDVVEFFAVTSEAFFTQPCAFKSEQPELYGLYRNFYRQDPASYERP